MRLNRLHRAAWVGLAALLAAQAGFARSAPAYKGAIAMDALTGAVLFEDNADAISPPASMTKLMTFAVLYDDLKQGSLALDTPVTVTAEDAKVAALKDSTEVWLRQGETFSVDELIYAMMIQSANDAAYALAHKAGGTVTAFVAEMNTKAHELGMTRSTFRTPNGFPPRNRKIADGDLTTPRDFALLCRYLLLHTDILKFTSVKTRPFGAGVRAQPVLMTNHNHLLWKIPGVDGLKTGFTGGAGFCLSATAERNGHRVIVVTMDSPDWRTRDLNVAEIISDALLKVPVAEAAFAQGQTKMAPAAGPAPASTPAAPTRPSPTPTPETGPVIHMPGK
ncbi:MAG TPA: D-alanyl-D-alanine carboxypeptidase family protein [Opitutaceae bacterium]